MATRRDVLKAGGALALAEMLRSKGTLAAQPESAPSAGKPGRPSCSPAIGAGLFWKRLRV